MPLPRSLANIQREISEKKWVEARRWAGGRISKTRCRMPKSQRPNGTVAGSTKRLASRFCQLKTGPESTCTGQGSPFRSVLAVQGPYADERTPLQGVPEVEGSAEDPMGGGAEGDREVEEPVEDPGSSRRRKVGSGGAGFPFVYGCGGGWCRLRKQTSTRGVSCRNGSSGSSGSVKRRRAEEPGEEEPLFLPTPSFMAAAEEG